jgi:hypothetical protein
MRLPIQSAFSIVSKLGPDEASRRLSAAPFRGRISGTSFDVMRTSTGRNSFRPRIRGTIEPRSGGSTIRGTMRLHEVVVVFMGFFFAVATWFFLNLFLHSVSTGRWDALMFVFPAAVVFLLVMMVLGFTYESRRARDDLAAILEAEPSRS